MPTSNPLHIPAVLHFALAVRPRRVLDIGVGMGCNGFLIRQFGDVAAERLCRDDWQMRIEGVEIFPQYRNPTWDFAYDKVHMGDVREILPRLPMYDVILCTDVLEHFPLAVARALVDEMLQHAPVLVVTTPAKYMPQGEWGGNPAEAHHCVLTAADLPNLVVKESVGITACFVCCKDPSMKELVRNAALVCPRFKRGRVTGIPRRAFNKLHRLMTRQK